MKKLLNFQNDVHLDRLMACPRYRRKKSRTFGTEGGRERKVGEGEEEASFPINLKVRWLQEIISAFFGKSELSRRTYKKNGRAADGPPHGGAEEGRGGLVGARRAGRHGAWPQILSTVS